ncbi:hypothetical protein CFC21_028978 [Triticum aestivum]|uniref:GIY-YIG domain-containing protein n=2 Tax=Triticum aestivum TaxID=4565 RepID=A0A9R1ERQ1_WHEAT|nr:protein EFFECTOR OF TRANSCRIPTION 2-like [Triticum aestivum]KAF7015061.1 hypothetical protein CFC21_028978 [Triticum aestivum]
MPAVAAARLKREDCPRTKHDSLFSPWKVLVGPSDWEDHSAGKEGVQRYHTRNLPDNFPGLYELGVARPSYDGVRARRNRSAVVVVVYLGQADNVRARLQQYGRTGSHLDTGNPLAAVGKAEMNALTAGPGLFREVFSRGYSVMFRCALMCSKKAAEKTEAQLLGVFDYAWNKLQNGVCRREEILLKLEQGSHRLSLLGRVRHLKQRVFGEKAGIKINSSGSVEISSGSMKNMLPRVRAFVGFRPHLVNSGGDLNEATDIHRKCTSQANTAGNKQAHRRSEGYKVKKIDVIKRRTAPIREAEAVCGVTLEDGSSCLEDPLEGRKRCELHKGRRVRVAYGRKVSSSSSTCQVAIPTVESIPQQTANPSKPDQAWQTSADQSKNLSTNAKEPSRQRNGFEAKEMKIGEAPAEDEAYGASHAESQFHQDEPVGRKWFELLKAQKSASAPSSRGQGCQTREANDDASAICGVVTDNGYCKLAPVTGRERCEEHRGIEVTGASSAPCSGRLGWPSICGARASDGSPCKNQPIAGRKRCGLHKGQRACCASTPSVK